MEKKEILDKLNRAYLMEEEMAGVLIGLCHSESLPEDIAKGPRERIANILFGIKADTERHKKIVSEKRKELL